MSAPGRAPGPRLGCADSADLCTARSERFTLWLGGGFPDKHSWRLDSDERPMHLYMYTRPWYGSFTTELRHQPAARGSSTVTLRAGGYSDFDNACRGLAR